MIVDREREIEAFKSEEYWKITALLAPQGTVTYAADPAALQGAVAAGADGVFLEVHDDPARALSDGSNALPLDRLPALLAKLAPLADLVRTVGIA